MTLHTRQASQLSPLQPRLRSLFLSLSSSSLYTTPTLYTILKMEHHSLDNQTTKVEHNNYDLEAGTNGGANMVGGAALGRQVSVRF